MKYLLIIISCILFISCEFHLRIWNVQEAVKIVSKVEVIGSKKDSVKVDITSKIYKHKLTKRFLKEGVEFSFNYWYKPKPKDPNFRLDEPFQFGKATFTFKKERKQKMYEKSSSFKLPYNKEFGLGKLSCRVVANSYLKNKIQESEIFDVAWDEIKE